jgi:hypothetical protein
MRPPRAGVTHAAYAWHNGDLSFVGYPTGSFGQELISEDGSKFLLLSHVESGIAPADLRGPLHSFVFDLQTETTECVDCDGLLSEVPGPTGHVIGVLPRLRTNTRRLDNDGGLLFHSRLRLSPSDQNGVIQDAYLWKDGDVRLLSSGRGFDDHILLAGSEDHSDAFIITRDQLVRADRDRSYDMYDVRVNGGFAEPEVDIPCEGEDCQRPPTAPPAEAGAGSGSYVGPGNVRGSGAGCRSQRAAVSKAKRLVAKARGPKRTQAKKRLARSRRALAACRGGNA